MQAMRISSAGSPKASGSPPGAAGIAGRRRPGRPRRLAAGASDAGARGLFRRGRLPPPVLTQGGEPEPRVLPQHPQLAPDIRQVHGAGLVDAEVQFRPHALVLAQGAGEIADRLVPLGGQPLPLRLNHPRGIGERQGADLAGPPRLARLVPIGRRVDEAVGLAEEFVERGGHHCAGGVPRLGGRLRGVLVLLRLFVLEEKVAVVFVDVAEQGPLERRRVGARMAAVGRVGHVPVGPFEPTRIVRPEIALRRTDAGADVAVGAHHGNHVVRLAPHADHREVVEQRRRDDHLDLVLAGPLAAAEPPRAGLLAGDGVILDLLLRQGGQVGRVAPMGLRGEPPRRRRDGRLARGVPGVEVIAVEQLEGEHLRRLRNLPGHLHQQRAGAAVAEVDHHVDVLRVAGRGRRGAYADLDGRNPLQRLALDVQQPVQTDHKVLRQRRGEAEIAELRVAATGVHGEEQPRGARLDDLPLDKRKRLRRLAFVRRSRAASLPAVADLAALVAASAAERDADELDAGVCK